LSEDFGECALLNRTPKSNQELNSKMKPKLHVLALACSTFGVTAAFADDTTTSCAALPDYSTLKTALTTAVATETSGLNNQMWATIVDRDGNVCQVVYSGSSRGAQWPGSRVISAQKANTANAFSLDPSSNSAGSGQAAGLALSTANLYAAVQPGGSLFGLQESNPVNVSAAYAGPSIRYGAQNDPLVGSKIGGVNVFGGGLALYATNHAVVGGLGVSGDTSCADHNIAWRVRNLLGLDHMGANGTVGAVVGPAGLAGDAGHPDNIIFDINNAGVSKSGFGHPTCLNPPDKTATLPNVVP
jgi:uncharacterized protein GlcG (DUF336 family)